MADSEPGHEVARSELRASHDDRDRVVELLRVSAGDGRLTAEELDERLGAAMTARTYGELAKLVADLPAAGSVSSAPAPRVKEVVRIDTGSGNTVRNGRWVVPQRIEARIRSAGCVMTACLKSSSTCPLVTFTSSRCGTTHRPSRLA